MWLAVESSLVALPARLKAVRKALPATDVSRDAAWLLGAPRESGRGAEQRVPRQDVTFPRHAEVAATAPAAEQARKATPVWEERSAAQRLNGREGTGYPGLLLLPAPVPSTNLGN